jgi:hypothetical protein
MSNHGCIKEISRAGNNLVQKTAYIRDIIENTDPE